jgi:hypothetical protein
MKKILVLIGIIMMLFMLVGPLLAQCSNGRCGIDNNPWQAVPQSQPQQYQQPQAQPTASYIQGEGVYASVVRITATESRGARKGSGVIVRWGTKLVILTARHVIKNANMAIHARVSGKWFQTRVLGVDTEWDVAILEVPPTLEVPYNEVAYTVDGQVKPGDIVEACGFGSDDRLAKFVGPVKGFSSNKPSGSSADWLEMVGHARQGDSGGPVYRQGKLVGVLWGTDSDSISATQVGRLHVILTRVLGPSQPMEQMQFFGSSGCLGGICKPKQPTPPSTVQTYPQPSINVQADPRVGDALRGINSKLDVVIENTTPIQAEPELQPEIANDDADKVNPGVIAGIIMLAVASVVFVKFKSGGI